MQTSPLDVLWITHADDSCRTSQQRLRQRCGSLVGWVLMSWKVNALLEQRQILKRIWYPEESCYSWNLNATLGLPCQMLALTAAFFETSRILPSCSHSTFIFILRFSLPHKKVRSLCRFIEFKATIISIVLHKGLWFGGCWFSLLPTGISTGFYQMNSYRDTWGHLPSLQCTTSFFKILLALLRSLKWKLCCAVILYNLVHNWNFKSGTDRFFFFTSLLYKQFSCST